MAHEIGEMFYYGDVPWHGLGRTVEAGDRLKSTAYQHAVAEASGRVVSIEDRRESHAGPARA